MELNVGKELAALKRMTVNELRRRYAEVFGDETKTGNKVWLVKRIVWRLQAMAEGDLSERARRRAAELANDADLRMNPPKVKATIPFKGADVTTATVRTRGHDRLPPPGTLITREYKGELMQVRVVANGFEYEGEIYKSLSAVAKKITGQHCNGYYFFRLGGSGGGK